MSAVNVDASALRLAIGDASPEWYGAGFARAFYRAVGGGRLTVDTLDRMATTLGVHYSQLVKEESDMRAIDASTFLEAIDERRDTRDVPVGACGSCGKNPAAPGFAMCVRCRDAAGLKTDEETRRAADALLARMKQQQAAAHEKFVKKTTIVKERTMATQKPWTPEQVERLKMLAAEGKSMNDAAQEFERTQASIQKFASKHGIRFHGRSGRKKLHAKPIATPISEPAPEPELATFTDAMTGEHVVDVTCTTACEVPCDQNDGGMCLAASVWGTCADRLEYVPIEEGAIEPADFNADASIEERTCPDCTCEADEEDAPETPCDEPCEALRHLAGPGVEDVRPGPRSGLTVTVDVTGIPGLKLMVRDYEETIDILAERLAELENRIAGQSEHATWWPFGRKPTVRDLITTEDVKLTAGYELDMRKRRAFRGRMAAAIADIESAIFDEPRDGDAA